MPSPRPGASVEDMTDGQLNGKKVAFLVAGEGIEQVELTEPWKAVQTAGGEPVLISPQAGSVQAFDHLDAADTFAVDVVVDDASVADYAALVLPGGVANPDALRTSAAAVEFVRAFAASGAPVAAICHAPWTLVEADVLRDRRLTSWPSLQTDLRNAGAQWVDEEVVVDRTGPGPLITSRNPGDLPAFNRALLEALA
jgi:protease I